MTPYWDGGGSHPLAPPPYSALLGPPHPIVSILGLGGVSRGGGGSHPMAPPPHSVHIGMGGGLTGGGGLTQCPPNPIVSILGWGGVSPYAPPTP